MMRTLTAVGFVALNALLWLTAPLQAQEEPAPETTPQCQAALTAAQSCLESGRQLQVAINHSNSPQSYPDHPLHRPSGYTLVIKGTATGAVLNSPKLMLSIATDVIHACDTVSLVSLFVAYSDNHVDFGLMSDGQVKAFECFQPEGTGRLTWKLLWGQMFCE